MTKRLRQAFQFGAAFSLALLPRPLLAIAGLGYMGTLAVRRTSSQPAIQHDDGDDDNEVQIIDLNNVE